MNSKGFVGRAKLIEAVDAAVVKSSKPEIAEALRISLGKLMQANDIELPACVLQPAHGRYARRQLYLSDRFGYSIIAMTWSPGQGTPIHDHSGMWCVEAVWRGALEVVQYERLDHLERVSRLRAVGSMLAGQGSVGSLIPPFEYHSIRNPSEDAVAVSIHVYAGQMSRCAVYEPIDQGTYYQRNERWLSLDPLAQEPAANE